MRLTCPLDGDPGLVRPAGVERLTCEVGGGGGGERSGPSKTSSLSRWNRGIRVCPPTCSTRAVVESPETRVAEELSDSTPPPRTDNYQCQPPPRSSPRPNFLSTLGLSPPQFPSPPQSVPSSGSGRQAEDMDPVAVQKVGEG